MARPKGQPKLGGRKKGTPNKKTTAVKEALQEAFEGMGGVKSLMAWAKTEPGEFYKLWVKILPLTVTGDADSKSPLQITVHRAGTEKGQ